MTIPDPVWATVAELSQAFAARTFSPIDAVDALLARIAKRDPSLHAYIAVYEDEARLAAEAADKAIRSGHCIGPLHGIPVALKDLIDLEGARDDWRIEGVGKACVARHCDPGAAADHRWNDHPR